MLWKKNKKLQQKQFNSNFTTDNTVTFWLI